MSTHNEADTKETSAAEKVESNATSDDNDDYCSYWLQYATGRGIAKRTIGIFQMEI
jgi:hypothetical protein